MCELWVSYGSCLRAVVTSRFVAFHEQYLMDVMATSIAMAQLRVYLWAGQLIEALVRTQRRGES
jgi:hypothetical protein